LSNYFTGLAKGDVATSISMTATSTILSVVVTPLVFGLWASLNPVTATLLDEIGIDVGRVIGVLMIMVVVPVTLGMSVHARRPALAAKVRRTVRRAAMVVFGIVVAAVLGSNFALLVAHAGTALGPVLLTFAIAAGLGWLLARLARLDRVARSPSRSPCRTSASPSAPPSRSSRRSSASP
jgi:BASS family bile acid:Na+ symporter